LINSSTKSRSRAGSGPLPTLASLSGAAVQLHQTGHRCLAQRSGDCSDRVADEAANGLSFFKGCFVERLQSINPEKEHALA